MGWNYPPGVTGNEYAIAGADSEWEEQHWCEQCLTTTVWAIERYGSEAWATCVGCDASVEADLDPDDGRLYFDWEDDPGYSEQELAEILADRAESEAA